MGGGTLERDPPTSHNWPPPSRSSTNKSIWARGARACVGRRFASFCFRPSVVPFDFFGKAGRRWRPESGGGTSWKVIQRRVSNKGVQKL
jgi:hypothetical protein